MNLHDRDNFRRGLKEGFSQGISPGSQQTKIETAKNLLKENISPEIISRTTGLSIEEITSLKK